MPTSTGPAKPVVGVLSVGDMGMGVAKLLVAHDYQVYTTSAGRSQHTKDRIRAANINDVASDEELVIECDVIFSIVPPRDAVAISKRIHTACKITSVKRHEQGRTGPLLYIDMNAISARTTKKIAGLFVPTEKAPPSLTRKLTRSLSMNRSITDVQADIEPVSVTYLDGGIIGSPPTVLADKSWKRPSIVVSGPTEGTLPSDLITVLNMKVISDEIGAASTLKACFASFGKGLFALAIASFTTAHTAGILPELENHLQEFFPSIWTFVEKGVPSVPPKAYRWVDEMQHIGETLSDEGRFEADHEAQTMFEGISEIYKLMADGTVLGKEIIGKRKRGTTVQDVAEAMREGIEAKKTKKPSDEKLELAWRGSWS